MGANVTDPLAAALHGTDPQNLLEYITRQRIYDCRYWKEECFGLTAADVLEKATSLKAVGASFGGNSQPTKFLCLILKLLQIQPPQELIDTFVEVEEDDFKYARALGAFYKRLTARPAEIYEKLEPLYTDYRKMRYREVSLWKLMRMDEFIHLLLTQDRVCGIALPRLASRQVLVEEGYLPGEYRSPLHEVVAEAGSLEAYLYTKVQDGSKAALFVWEQREARRKERLAKEEEQQEALSTLRRQRADIGGHRPTRRDNERDRLHDRPGNHRDGEAGEVHASVEAKRPMSIADDDDRVTKKSRKEKKRKDKKEKGEGYGSLFKSSSSSTKQTKQATAKTSDAAPVEENSEEFWNQERAKLGLKPLRK